MESSGVAGIFGWEIDPPCLDLEEFSIFVERLETDCVVLRLLRWWQECTSLCHLFFHPFVVLAGRQPMSRWRVAHG